VSFFENASSAASIAAKNGHLDCLRYLHEHGCPWGFRESAECAEGGHLDCLQYLHEQGCPLDKWTITNAAENGHLDCLRYLQEHGCPRDDKIIYDTAICGKLDCLRYLYENGCPWNKDIDYDCIYATVKYGNFDCLEYIIRQNCTDSLSSLFDAFNTKTARSKINFDQQPWLRELLFPHVNSPCLKKTALKKLCQRKISQIILEKQATIDILATAISLDVVKHCLHSFI
jgi:hypothetical protein